MGARAVAADAAARPISSGSSRAADPVPADALLHPIVLAALGVLVLNDHVLKALWPGAVTGKLSDIAGLVFFPVLLVSAHELACAARGRWLGPSHRAAVAAIALTGLAFLLVKTLPGAAAAAGWLLGTAQWAVALPVRVALGAPLGSITPGVIVVDATDLLALPAVAVAAWILR